MKGLFPSCASPWDGFSRTPLRVGIAVVVIVDLLGLAASVYFATVSKRTHPAALSLFLALSGNAIALAVILAVGLWGAVGFLTGKRLEARGLLALGILFVLSEAHAAIVGGPARNFYPVGAALSGWLFGLAYARAARAPNRDELAEVGACAGIAATYVGAAMSKLAASGLAWAAEDGLRAVILSQHRVSDISLRGTYEHWAVDYAWVSQALAALTLLTQGGAFLWLGGRKLRALWGTMIVAFHTNVWLLTGIKYLEPLVLAMLLSYPWPRWLGAKHVEEAPLARDAAAEGRAAVFTVSAIVVIVLIVLATGVRGYTTLHHRRG